MGKRTLKSKLDWESLSPERKDLYITLLWKDGHTDQAIADFLHASKGKIVGHRHRHLPSLKFRSAESTVKSEVDPERLRDLLDLDQMEEMRARGVEVSGPVSHDHLFLSEDESEIEEDSDEELRSEEIESTPIQEEVYAGPKCEWPSTKNIPCGKPAVEGHKLCEEHLEMIKRGRR
jgi:hypothetical protein